MLTCGLRTRIPTNRPITVSVVLALVGVAHAAAHAAEPRRTAFRPAEKKGVFSFDTGILRGVLRLDGRRQGIERLIHIPTGVEVTYGGGHVGLLSPYRLFRPEPGMATLHATGRVSRAACRTDPWKLISLPVRTTLWK
ncbi:MAG TPA: hypothetical protein EYP14_20800 [Planctomycetaceae bacterium]|nr:hypothetical protein [Planctomycetaceae bacterium]